MCLSRFYARLTYFPHIFTNCRHCHVPRVITYHIIIKNDRRNSGGTLRQKEKIEKQKNQKKEKKEKKEKKMKKEKKDKKEKKKKKERKKKKEKKMKKGK